MHQYRITIEGHNQSLTFQVSNHDNIIEIAERIKHLNWLKESDAYSTIIGLKLLSEVALKHRNDTLFKDIEIPLRNFILGLKKKRIDSDIC